MSVKTWVITLSETSTSNFTSKQRLFGCFLCFRIREEDAEKAQDAINERWFGGEAINAELRPGLN